MAATNTLLTMYFTRQSSLSYPFLLELALACIVQVSRRWLLASIGIAAAAWLPLILTYGDEEIGIQIGSVLGLLTTAALISSRLRRSLDDALHQQEALARTAAELAKELEERRRAEEQRERLRDQFVHAQRLEATGTLAAGLAHDMNNILGAIVGNAQLLAEDPSNERLRAELSEIVHEGERGAALTRGLLAYARRGQYERRTVQLEAILREMDPVLSRLLPKRVSVTWRGTTAAVVDCDAAQIRQVLMNLCVNAAQSIDANGSITIGLEDVVLAGARAELLDLPPGPYASFSVEDTGAGMTEEVRARMFEPFFTTKPLGSGTGLGLAMVHGTVLGHGGAIEVESVARKGSTFRVFLPTTELPVAPEGVSVPLIEKPSTARVALVIDDEPIFRRVVRRILEQMGLTVLDAANGEAGIELFTAHADTIAFVVLDMSMPMMDGPECFDRLRAVRRVPTLLVSGYTDDALTQRLLAAGDTRFLEKPFRPDLLRETVKAMLGQPT